jgi:hypothetical protein
MSASMDHRMTSPTGGDRIAARFMREDFFESKPQFKLVSAGSHQPTLRMVDEGPDPAMGRRGHSPPPSTVGTNECRISHDHLLRHPSVSARSLLLAAFAQESVRCKSRAIERPEHRRYEVG